MKRLIVLAVMMVFVGFGARAQEETAEYRLHVPTAEEYLEAIPKIVASSYDELGNASQDVVSNLERDFLLRFGDTADAITLSKAYAKLNYGYSLWSNYQPYLNLVRWNMLIVQRWLKDHLTDLSTVHELKFDIYTISVEEHDYDRNGTTEWLLHVWRGEGSNYPEFGDYWTAQRNPSQEGGYAFTSLPIPYKADGYWPAQEEWAGASLQKVEDVNHDGQAEYIFRAVSAIPSSGQAGADYVFYLLGWKENQFQVLTNWIIKDADGSTRPVVGGTLRVRAEGGNFWTFENIDSDDALELIETVHYQDNWECKRNTRRVFDWDGDYYTEVENENIRAESMNCALADAQAAMWAYDYEAAVSLYELALERYEQGVFEISENAEEFAGYAQERLVLAYALAGRQTDAEQLLTEMAAQHLSERTIGAQLVQAATDGTNAFELCKTAYDYLKNFPGLYDDDRDEYRGLSRLGYTSEESYAEVAMYSPPDAIRGGCDFGKVAQDIILNHVFPSTESPLVGFEELGIEVSQSIHADLNLDGVDEWVIQTPYNYQRLFFLSVEGQYRVSITDFILPDERIEVLTHLLPDNVGVAWIRYYFAGAPKQCTFYDGTVFGSDNARWNLDIWQVINSGLVKTQTIPTCERQQISDLFQSEGEIQGWVAVDETSSAALEPAIYTWDSQQRLYVPASNETPTPSPLVPTPTSIVTITSTPLPYDRYNYFFHYRAFVEDGDFTSAIEVIDMVLRYTESDNWLKFQLLYWRALALEALNRPDEALAEYVAIYESAPESAWGMLAGLHLEVVAG